jgi:hypothetical protein
VDAKTQLEEELEVERHANAEYEAYRKRERDETSRGLGAQPKPYQPPERPAGKVNLHNPDSRLVHGMRGWIQGNNVQAACNEQHLIVAARYTRCG